MKKELGENFGEALRLRACGILINEHGILMVRHQGLSEAGYLWAPPGGGMEYGQSACECLEREFLEETGLIITTEEFMFVNEFHAAPLHAVELFFKVKQTGGQLKIGFDPELGPDQQIIDEVRYFQQNDLEDQHGPQLHSIFKEINHPQEILNLSGYFQNWK
jgi:8-oxo-dGTP diphosphatase